MAWWCADCRTDGTELSVPIFWWKSRPAERRAMTPSNTSNTSRTSKLSEISSTKSLWCLWCKYIFLFFAYSITKTGANIMATRCYTPLQSFKRNCSTASSLVYFVCIYVFTMHAVSNKKHLSLYKRRANASYNTLLTQIPACFYMQQWNENLVA